MAFPSARADAAAPPGVRADDRWPSLLAASLDIEVRKLTQFRELMARSGFTLDASRLFFDPFYAYRRFELAHTSGDAALRAMAVELFEQYRQLERRRRSVSAFNRPH